jgi:hypothetical protein
VSSVWAIVSAGPGGLPYPTGVHIRGDIGKVAGMMAWCVRSGWVAWLALFSGCAMCLNCDDCSYPADGGRWQRLDPCFGRVASAFTPEVGTRVDAGVMEPYLEPVVPGEPTPAEDAIPADPPPAGGDVPETSVLHSRDVISR